MKQRYKKLRIRMMECDIDLKHLAGVILRGRTTTSARLNGHEPWDLDEIYAICGALDIPHSEIHIFFPPMVPNASRVNGHPDKKALACVQNRKALG